MKKMIGIKIRTIALALILTLLVGWRGAYTVSPRSGMNFLVVGVDNASENTDVISVVRLDANEKKVSFIQIPRDTYCNLEVYQNKINHIYSLARAEGKSRAESVARLRNFLSEELSVKFDGHVLIDRDAFLRIVEAIGGVDVKLTDDLTLFNGDKAILELHKGVNHLDPESAMLFVRHRAGYLRGDIQRLEMQSIFIRGLFDTLMNRVRALDVLRAASVLKTCETDISTKSLISLFSNRKLFSSATPEGLMLPGEAIKGKNGVWYYALNRRGCDELISRVFMLDSGSFDRDKHFLNTSDADFRNIYFK